MQLPFDDASFDAVVCQFGVMFFPDKAKAFAEARRVLRPGGAFFFNVWDRIEDNEFADVVTDALAPLFPADPPRFMARTPHGYHDRATIERDLARRRLRGAGADRDGRGAQPGADARAIRRSPYCQGSPLRSEIEARATRRGSARRPTRAPRRSRAASARGPVDGKIQAHVVTVER